MCKETILILECREIKTLNFLHVLLPLTTKLAYAPSASVIRGCRGLFPKSLPSTPSVIVLFPLHTLQSWIVRYIIQTPEV